MTEARLALPGQSTPGPDAYRACRQQERKRIIGQRDAPPYEGDLRLQRSIGREPTEGHLSGPQLRTAIRSIWVLSPPGRHPGSSRPEPSPPAPPFRLPPPGAAQLPHPPHPSVRLAHLCRSDRDTEFPDLEPCCGRAPTRSRRSYRRFTLRLSSQSVTDHDREPPPGGRSGQAAAFPGPGGLYLAAPAT